LAKPPLEAGDKVPDRYYVRCYECLELTAIKLKTSYCANI